MSDNLLYNGKCLGYVHCVTGDTDKINKFILEMEGLNGLEIMCKLSDKDIVKVGDRHMLYSEFKNRILGNLKRIYLSTHEYILDRI